MDTARIESLGLAPLRNFTPFLDLPLSQYYFSCAASPYTPFNRQKHSLYRDTFVDALGPQVSDEPTRRLFKRLVSDTPAVYRRRKRMPDAVREMGLTS